MKIIKNRLRNSHGDEKLSDLILLSEEKYRLEKLNFDEFLNIFIRDKKILIAQIKNKNTNELL